MLAQHLEPLGENQPPSKAATRAQAVSPATFCTRGLEAGLRLVALVWVLFSPQGTTSGQKVMGKGGKVL